MNDDAAQDRGVWNPSKGPTIGENNRKYAPNTAHPTGADAQLQKKPKSSFVAGVPLATISYKIHLRQKPARCTGADPV